MSQSPPAHRARKRFGQNFLHDPGIIQRIIDAIHPMPGELIVEIGPGQAALTEYLVASGASVNAIELDRDLADWLEPHFATASNFQLHRSDILKFDLNTILDAHDLDAHNNGDARPMRVIGNLPYNISTPCLFHLLKYADRIKDMVFMLQKEVVQRLAAEPGSGQYGRLSVMIQYHCQVDALFDVPPGAFNPPPKVTSAIVRLRPRQQIEHSALDPAMFQTVVREAFSQRRKTLRNCLKPLLKQYPEADMPIDLSRRAETLAVAEFVQLSNAFSQS